MTTPVTAIPTDAQGAAAIESEVPGSIPQEAIVLLSALSAVVGDCIDASSATNFMWMSDPNHAWLAIDWSTGKVVVVAMPHPDNEDEIACATEVAEFCADNDVVFQVFECVPSGITIH